MGRTLAANSLLACSACGNAATWSAAQQLVRLHEKGATVPMRRILAGLVAMSFVASVEAQPVKQQPTEEDCLGLLAVLPTFEIAEMKTFYESNRNVSGKQLAERLRSLADGGDKDAQFTYGRLLLAGYCVPQDFCAAKSYREKSRGGKNDWEKHYPLPPWTAQKEKEASCT